ncbi:hypothetical protein EW026_g69 [Hermanssonia centrifuga]|uniref:INO80 complex subunit B-like conserved region domain-containing protein n=1 Tax=Hermanssonia centrifuga TaxID=98765 RepID=A0A4S4KVY4_9APHY|nr:hypothetical protein EW026_g69 [Hermanssonia centrifuga]
MPRRGRRRRQPDIPTSDADMDVGEEDPIVDQEDPDIVVDDDEEDMSESKEDELEDDEEAEDSEDAVSSAPPEVPEPGPSLPPRLRIKLKLPAQMSGLSSVAATATGASTPSGYIRRGFPSRGTDIYLTIVLRTKTIYSLIDVDIESEDTDEDADHSTRSTSVATNTGRALTARQAVLRNVVDSSHVSLIEPPNPRKKKQLTEIEMALKREETARKRRNLTEKKLEDEKAETINRLLKKQSRSKGKRNALATAEDRPTPLSLAAINGEEIDVEDGIEEGTIPSFVPPTMYRWTSTTKGTKDGQEPRMLISFSVPLTAIAQPSTLAHSAMEFNMVAKRKSDALESDVADLPKDAEEKSTRATKKSRVAGPSDASASSSKGTQETVSQTWRDIKLEGEDEDGGVAVYDDCNEIRRKIKALQKTPDFKVTHWLKEIGSINNNSFQRFMQAKGPTGGAGNGTYYAAYVYFEKNRVLEGKKKTPTRIRHENEQTGGFELRERKGMWVLSR